MATSGVLLIFVGAPERLKQTAEGFSLQSPPSGFGKAVERRESDSASPSNVKNLLNPKNASLAEEARPYRRQCGVGRGLCLGVTVRTVFGRSSKCRPLAPLLPERRLR